MWLWIDITYLPGTLAFRNGNFSNPIMQYPINADLEKVSSLSVCGMLLWWVRYSLSLKYHWSWKCLSYFVFKFAQGRPIQLPDHIHRIMSHQLGYNCNSCKFYSDLVSVRFNKVRPSTQTLKSMAGLALVIFFFFFTMIDLSEWVQILLCL